MIGIAMPVLDDYIIDVLMRDLVGHDRRPVSFLVYLWLAAEQSRRRADVRVSYQEVAESVGVSKSSVQTAIRWLLKRKLLTVTRQSMTATPCYTVRSPWRDAARRLANRPS
jgi:hypothetical protein